MSPASTVIIDSENYERLYVEVLGNMPLEVEMSNPCRKYSTAGLVDSKLVEDLWNFVHKSELARPDILVKCGIFLLTSEHQFNFVDHRS